MESFLRQNREKQVWRDMFFFNSFGEILNSVVTNNHDFSLNMWTLTRLVVKVNLIYTN